MQVRTDRFKVYLQKKKSFDAGEEKKNEVKISVRKKKAAASDHQTPVERGQSRANMKGREGCRSKKHKRGRASSRIHNDDARMKKEK